MTRGEVWWANLPPPAGRRPVLLVARKESYAVRGQVIVTPLTSRIRHLRSEVRLGPDDGLARPCVANLDVLNTIPLARLDEWITSLSPEKLAAVDAAIRFALGLDE